MKYVLLSDVTTNRGILLRHKGEPIYKIASQTSEVSAKRIQYPLVQWLG
jgi:hypothetical protein